MAMVVEIRRKRGQDCRPGDLERLGADQPLAWLAWACCQAALKLSSWASIV